MRRQSERMTTIITELLDLSRLEAAQDEIDTTPVDVTALMAMLRKDVLARHEHPGEVRLRVESDAMLTGNESEIHSALANLVDNAANTRPTPVRSRSAGVSMPRAAIFGLGYRHRHPRGPYPTADRAVLPGRCRSGARHGRIRARARDCQARAAAAWGDAGDRPASRDAAAPSPVISRRSACARRAHRRRMKWAARPQAKRGWRSARRWPFRKPSRPCHATDTGISEAHPYYSVRPGVI